MNSFKTSEKGINLIKSYEKLHTKAYKNKRRKEYTIGYGHSGEDIDKNLTICKEQAEVLLKYDIEKFEKYVNDPSYVPQKLNQNQFDALVSFTFNCGKENLKKLVGKKRLSEIANELKEYNKLDGKELKCMTKRREEEKNLFLSEDPAPILIKQDEIKNKNIGDFIQHIYTILENEKDEYNFLIGDYNHNGYYDIYCIKKYGKDGFIKVEILDGANNYNSWLLQTKTPLNEEEADWDFCLGDYNHDGHLDLFCIRKNKTGTNSTEVHVLSGKNDFKIFILQTGTILHETDNNCKFCVGDYNDDGELDLFYIKKKTTDSNSTEVHILSGKNLYNSFIMHTRTILHETDDNWEFGISNYVGNGNKDLYCINKRNEKGECTDVHILDGSKHFQSLVIRTITKLDMTDENFCFYPIDKKLFVIKKKGDKNYTECHILKL